MKPVGADVTTNIKPGKVDFVETNFRDFDKDSHFVRSYFFLQMQYSLSFLMPAGVSWLSDSSPLFSLFLLLLGSESEPGLVRGERALKGLLDPF